MRGMTHVHSRLPQVVVVFAATAALLATTSLAAADDCPPGSSSKSENGYSWCEPSVCETDAQCSGGELCRPLPLCVQVGKVDPKGAAADGDAGQRLVATQRCAPDKACPNTTVCSEKSRCITKAQADKMGLLTVNASPTGSAGAAGAPEKKSSCGCDVPGHRATRSDTPLALAALGLGLVLARRRRT